MIKALHKIYESINRLEKENSLKTIICGHVPFPYNISYFLSDLLRNAGDVRFDRGSIKDKKQRLISWIKDTGIKMIVIDGFRVKQFSQRDISEVFGFLKEILHETGISLVVAASPEIYRFHEMLQELFQKAIPLVNIPFKKVSEKETFKSILKEIEMQLPFDKPSNSSDFSNEIYKVTHGNFYRIETLITGAEFLAKKNGEQNISLKSMYLSSDVMYGIPQKKPFYNRLLIEEENRRKILELPERAVKIAELKYKVIKPKLSPEVDEIIDRVIIAALSRKKRVTSEEIRFIAGVEIRERNKNTLSLN